MYTLYGSGNVLWMNAPHDSSPADEEAREDTLLTTEEALDLIESVTGKRLKAEAWRKYVKVKTETNPAPDPVPADEVPQDDPRFQRSGGGRPRVAFWESQIRHWAENRPGVGSRVLPSLPDLWDSRECAEEVGISLGAWDNAVAEKTTTNPAPDPVPASEVPPAQRWRRFWRPSEVLEWAANRPGYGNWQPRVLDPSDLKRGEWPAQRCADEAGVTVQTWTRWVNDPKSGAPQPKRQVKGRWWLWSAAEVRRYLHKRDS